MKLVPKPEGFELRDKRSDKAADASKWSAADALFDASSEMAKQDTDCAIVCWREQYKDGTSKIDYRCSGAEGTGIKLLISALGRLMGWT